MKHITLRYLPVATWIVAGGLCHVTAATPLPSWYGEPGTTRQGSTFTTGSLVPVPEIRENPYGTPSATVVLGGFSAGWQNPANPYDLAGADADGAWDLGMAGSITIVCPITLTAAPPGTTYRVDFVVYTVGYSGITSLPAFDSHGMSVLSLAFSQNKVADDTSFPGASWQGLKWSGHLENLTSNSVSFSIRAPAGNTSVVDSFEVFTRVTPVPEPSPLAMVLLPAISWILRRRRCQ